MTNTFTVTLDNRSEMAFHKAGCRDIARNRRRGLIQNTWNVEAETVEEAVAEEVADFEAQDMGYTADDFRVFPCCKSNA